MNYLPCWWWWIHSINRTLQNLFNFISFCIPQKENSFSFYFFFLLFDLFIFSTDQHFSFLIIFFSLYIFIFYFTKIAIFFNFHSIFTLFNFLMKIATLNIFLIHSINSQLNFSRQLFPLFIPFLDNFQIFFSIPQFENLIENGIFFNFRCFASVVSPTLNSQRNLVFRVEKILKLEWCMLLF